MNKPQVDTPIARCLGTWLSLDTFMSVSMPSSFDVNCAPQRYLAGRVRESEMEGRVRE